MKIERSQVELVLADSTADPVSRWHVNDTFNRELVAELCRAWLALDAAPEVEVTKRSATFGHGDCGVQWVIGDSYSPPPLIAQGMYVKYRLVPVVEATPASGGPRDG